MEDLKHICVKMNRSIWMKHGPRVSFDLRRYLFIAGGQLLPKSHQGGNLCCSYNFHIDQTFLVVIFRLLWESCNCLQTGRTAGFYILPSEDGRAADSA